MHLRHQVSPSIPFLQQRLQPQRLSVHNNDKYLLTESEGSGAETDMKRRGEGRTDFARRKQSERISEGEGGRDGGINKLAERDQQGFGVLEESWLEET